MKGLGDIMGFIPWKRPLHFKEYTEYDEIYSLWRFGFNLGDILFVAYNLKIGSDIIINDDTKVVNTEVKQFGQSYSTLQAHAVSLSKENSIAKNTIEELLKYTDNNKISLAELNVRVDNLKKTIEHDIETISTHLKNIFLFGFTLKKLNAIIIDPNYDKDKLHEATYETLICIDNIEEGDKRLESKNLEISQKNLKLVRIIVELLTGKIAKLYDLQVKGKDPVKCKNFINEMFFRTITDIILDIENPGHFARHKFLLYVIYYYMFVAVITMIEYLTRITNLSSFIERISIFGKTEKTQVIEWLIYLLPIVAYLIFYLFMNLNQWLIRRFVIMNLKSSIRRFRKQNALG